MSVEAILKELQVTIGKIQQRNQELEAENAALRGSSTTDPMKYLIMVSDGNGISDFLGRFTHKEVAVRAAKGLAETVNFQFNDAFTEFENGGPIQGRLSVVVEPNMEVIWEADNDERS